MDFETVTAEGYGFQIEMTHRLVRAGGRIVEFPIAFRDRGPVTSKLSQGIVGEAAGLVARLWIDDRRGRRTRRRQSRLTSVLLSGCLGQHVRPGSGPGRRVGEGDGPELGQAAGHDQLADADRRPRPGTAPAGSGP